MPDGYSIKGLLKGVSLSELLHIKCLNDIFPTDAGEDETFRQWGTPRDVEPDLLFGGGVIGHSLFHVIGPQGIPFEFESYGPTFMAFVHLRRRFPSMSGSVGSVSDCKNYMNFMSFDESSVRVYEFIDVKNRTNDAYNDLLTRFPELNFYVQADVFWLKDEVESLQRFRDEITEEKGNKKHLNLDEHIEVLSKTFALEDVTSQDQLMGLSSGSPTWSANSSTYGEGCRRICRDCGKECSCWTYDSEHQVICDDCQAKHPEFSSQVTSQDSQESS